MENDWFKELKLAEGMNLEGWRLQEVFILFLELSLHEHRFVGVYKNREAAAEEAEKIRLDGQPEAKLSTIKVVSLIKDNWFIPFNWPQSQDGVNLIHELHVQTYNILCDSSTEDLILDKLPEVTWFKYRFGRLPGHSQISIYPDYYCLI